VRCSGGKIGTLVDIYLGDDTGQPEWATWATVTTGLFGARQSFVPLAEVEDLGDSIRVPYDRERVKSAPDMRAEGALSQDKEAALFRYYGLDYSVSRSGSGLPAGAAEKTSTSAATCGTPRSGATYPARPPTTP
jgi:hypothetical protein